jgi:hypothetical protein
VDVAGAVLETKNLPGLRQMREQRIIARVLGVMGVEAAHRPGDLAAGADHCAIEVDRQSAKIQSLDLFIAVLALDPRQRAQRGLGKLR